MSVHVCGRHLKEKGVRGVAKIEKLFNEWKWHEHAFGLSELQIAFIYTLLSVLLHSRRIHRRGVFANPQKYGKLIIPFRSFHTQCKFNFLS